MLENKVMYYENDKIEVVNGELSINGDFVDYVTYEYEYWKSLEKYYGVDEGIISLYSRGENVK